MSELISLFRRVSRQPASEYENRPYEPEAGKQPEYFVQLLEYLREQKQQQGRALRIAIAALAEAD